MKTSMKPEPALQETLKAIGAKLKQLRIEKGYTSHSHFATDHGLPSVQYWRIEKGKSNVTLYSLHKVLDIHGITFDQLFNSIAKDIRQKKIDIDGAG